MPEGSPNGIGPEQAENSSAWMAEYQPEPELSDVLNRLEAASGITAENKDSGLDALREEIDQTAQVVYNRFDELTGNGIPPQKVLSESRFIQAQDGFQVAQSKYVEAWMDQNLDILIIPGTKEFVELVQDSDPTNVRNYVDILPLLLKNGIIKNGIFRLDSLVQIPLNLLAPLAYENSVKQKGKEHAGQMYDELCTMAEIAGTGTVYDHFKLIGPTKADLIRQQVFLEDSLAGVPDDTTIAQVQKIGFSPNKLVTTPFGTPIRLTEPLIEPTVQFRF